MSKRRGKRRALKRAAINKSAAIRGIETHARKQCVALGLDPDEWGTYTLNYGAVSHLFRTAYSIC